VLIFKEIITFLNGRGKVEENTKKDLEGLCTLLEKYEIKGLGYYVSLSHDSNFVIYNKKLDKGVQFLIENGEAMVALYGGLKAVKMLAKELDSNCLCKIRVVK
jgi:hypothetical protein